MQNPLTSRSIISDRIYKKFSQTAYGIHKQRLKKIYTKDNMKKDIENDDDESINNLKRLINNRKAYESCHQKIDLKVQLENRALFKNLQKIITRRSNSEANLNNHKSHTIQNQKKELKKQNKILVEKLVLSKLEIADIKKNLHKQYQQYEEKKNMLRKLKQFPKQKRKSQIKRKSLSSKKNLNHEEKKANSNVVNEDKK